MLYLSCPLVSGSPIIQNGKLIGAVTHVFAGDSQKGYGIFIENMLETAQSVTEGNKLKKVTGTSFCSVSIEAEWKTELSNYELTVYTHPSSNSFAEALTSRTSALYWEIGSLKRLLN